MLTNATWLRTITDMEYVLRKYQANSLRLTKLREALAGIFCQAEKPLTVPEILSELKKYTLEPNKTTVYREFEILLKNKILKEVYFNDDKKRYEIIHEHHHHLVCKKCAKVIKIDCDQSFELQVERQAKKSNFVLENSSMEFFGKCSKCN